jgi:hypothetical protein
MPAALFWLVFTYAELVVNHGGFVPGGDLRSGALARAA